MSGSSSPPPLSALILCPVYTHCYCVTFISIPLWQIKCAALEVLGGLHVVLKEVGVVGFGFSFSLSKTSCFSQTFSDPRLLPYQSSARWLNVSSMYKSNVLGLVVLK